MNNPLFLLLMIGAGLYVVKLWNDDRRTPHPRALPGATMAPPRAVWIAIVGALVILALETFGETALGVADEQSTMTWLFALYSIIGAPIVEELIFRGYLVIDNKGRSVLWAAALAASLAFAAVHPFLWKWDDAGFALTLTPKGWFSAAAVFAFSLWLYVARFAGWNPSHSLLPCFAAHAAKNAGVVAIKAATGHMGGLW
jgi:uncharacterized protein